MAKTSRLFLFFVFLCWRLSAQETTAPDLRFRVSANLVQVDAIVTAPTGQAVPRLDAEDFEILEDGKPQQITTYSAAEHRTAVFLVDRCHTVLGPFEQSLNHFLDWLISSVRPGDRVAILNGCDGFAAVQQLTDNPQILREQAKLIGFPARLLNWCIDGWGKPLPIEAPLLETPRGVALRFSPHSIEDRIRVISPSGWLTLVLQEVSLAIDYLREEPGHKDLVLISANLMDPTRVKRAVEELTSRANRSGVTLHVMFPGAHPVPPPQPVLDPASRTLLSEDVAYQKSLLSYTNAAFLLSMLARIAQDTGGMFFEHPPFNRPARDPRQRLTYAERLGLPSEEEKLNMVRYLEQSWRSLISDYGVYTLGYRPNAVASGFHKISVRVRRPGLTVHARKGYYDTPEQPAAVVKSESEPLSAVLDAPLRGSAIRLSAQPFDSAQQAPDGRFRTVIRLVLSIDPRDLSWEVRGGRKRAFVQTTAVAHGEEHRVASSAAKDCELDETAGSSNASPQCIIELPFDAPGLYVVRAAVQDRVTGKTGFAYTVAAGTEHNASRLTLSDAVLVAVPPNGSPFSDAVFAPGAQVAYELSGYGMKLDKKSRQPKLAIRVGITSVTNGHPIFQGAETPVNAEGATWRATIKGKITLPNDLAPGDYMIEFVVGDKLSKVVLNRIAGFRVADRPPLLLGHYGMAETGSFPGKPGDGK